jgi:EmrB/QacA subfamily drug resistance transporter
MALTHRGALAAVITASAVVFLDGTVVNIALPRIGSELPSVGIGVLEGQVYVVAGYMAALAAFLLPAGALGDHYGRRRMYVVGLVAFGAVSLACGLAPSLDLLVIARLAQGFAGALLIPGSLAILTTLYEGPARVRAFGVWATVTSAVAIVGPPLGGILVETVGWRSVFLLNVPLVLGALAATLRFIPDLRSGSDAPRFDWPGSAAVAVAVGGLTFGAIRGQESGWSQPAAIAALAVGAAALLAFPVLMARRRDPLVPLELFRNRTFAAVNLSTFLVYGALFLVLYLQSLFLQNAVGYSALGAAIAAVPQGICLVLLSARAGTLASRHGMRPFMIGGPLVMAAGAALWLRVGPTSSPWLARLDDPASLLPSTGFFIDVLPAALLFAIGISIFVVPLTTTLMASIPVERAGLGSGINNALSRVGQPLLSAAAFILVSERFYASLASLVPGLDPGDPAIRAAIQPLNPPGPGLETALVSAAQLASADAFHTAIVGAAALLVLGAVVNARGVSERSGGLPAALST